MEKINNNYFHFSYETFIQILKAIKSNFSIHLFSDVPKILNKTDRAKLILRHDIDISLKSALRMAEIENKLMIRSTFMVIVDSPLYCIRDKTPQQILRRLIKMGHHIGLHYDLNNSENYGIYEIEKKVESACKRLEDTINMPVFSISFHRPTFSFLRGPLLICKRVNAYSRELMAYYLSDSSGSWQKTELLFKLLKPDKNISLFQLLIHPIWWGTKHMLPEDRLHEFFVTETQGQPLQSIKAFDAALRKTVPKIWKGYSCNNKNR